jgi:hypothetical protein
MTHLNEFLCIIIIIIIIFGCIVFLPFLLLLLQKDGLEGELASLDDSSPKNLESLVKLSEDLLDESVAVRNFDTGKLEPISSGETNPDALYRYPNPNPNYT